MEKVFDISLKNRKLLYKFLKETPKENLLEIPNGFRNNIWWNIAHVVVTQQLLVYKLGGQQMRVEEALVDKFKKGTAPDGTATDEEIALIGDLLISTVEWAKKDYEDGIFTTYNTYATSVDVTLEKVEDALAFNNFHEGIHLGAVLALSKVVGGKAN